MIYAYILPTSHDKGPGDKERNTILKEAIDVIIRRKAVNGTLRPGRNMFGTWLCKLDRPLVNMKILSYPCVGPGKWPVFHKYLLIALCLSLKVITLKGLNVTSFLYISCLLEGNVD